MPLNDQGQYVQIDAVTKQLIGEYMANLIRGGQLTEAQIVQQAGTRFAYQGHLDNSDTLPLHNLARQEQRAVDAANNMNANPGNPPANLPTIPSDTGFAGQNVYDVVVHATDPTTGQVHSDRFQIFSQADLSATDLHDMIDANRDQYLRQVRSPAPSPASIPSLQIDTIVIGAGRVATP